jgi:hypothetical protein
MVVYNVRLGVWLAFGADGQVWVSTEENTWRVA